MYNIFLFLDVPPKKPPVVTNSMAMNTAKTNPPITSKPIPVVSTAPSIPITNGNISSNYILKLFYSFYSLLIFDFLC